jgi:hypothetical protein
VGKVGKAQAAGKAAKPRAYAIRLADVYPLYVQKAERKGRKRSEVDRVILWLTGHTAQSFRRAVESGVDLEQFYAEAPRFQPKAKLIAGAVCGVRVEEIEDRTMWKIRCLDKLVDELAKGRAMDKVLRA